VTLQQDVLCTASSFCADPLVETASLASIPLPPPTFTPDSLKECIERKLLSDAQLETGELLGWLKRASAGAGPSLPGWRAAIWLDSVQCNACFFLLCVPAAMYLLPGLARRRAAVPLLPLVLLTCGRKKRLALLAPCLAQPGSYPPSCSHLRQHEVQWQGAAHR
jgi:hypothetical protein